MIRTEYKRAYQACLKLFWEHVKSKGWHDRFVLYISDEPFFQQAPIRRQMKALCAMIHEVDPAIPIYSSTWSHVPDWDGSLDIWGLGQFGDVSVETMARIRAGGAKIWFTTDGQMCLDTPYCAIERLLPHYAFRYGAEAYEFWGIAWLTHDPYRFGWHAYIHQTDQPGQSYWIRYPNGDGFLLYPGVPIGHARAGQLDPPGTGSRGGGRLRVSSPVTESRRPRESRTPRVSVGPARPRGGRPACSHSQCGWPVFDEDPP